MLRPTALDFACGELVGLAQVGHCLEKRSQTHRPVACRVESGDQQRATALAAYFDVVDELVLDQNDVLPHLIGAIGPVAPEHPHHADAFVGFGALDRAFLLRIDLVPDFLADQAANMGCVGPSDGGAIVDIAVGTEIDLQFADREGLAADGRAADVDPHAGEAAGEVRIVGFRQLGVEIGGLDGFEDEKIVFSDLVDDLIPGFLRDEHALAALAPRLGLRHERIHDLGDKFADQIVAQRRVQLR